MYGIFERVGHSLAKVRVGSEKYETIQAALDKMAPVISHSGVVSVENRIPPGTLLLMSGEDRQALQDRLEARARHAYDGVTLLCPGVPEADDDDTACNAVIAFRDFLNKEAR